MCVFRRPVWMGSAGMSFVGRSGMECPRLQGGVERGADGWGGMRPGCGAVEE